MTDAAGTRTRLRVLVPLGLTAALVLVAGAAVLVHATRPSGGGTHPAVSPSATATDAATGGSSPAAAPLPLAGRVIGIDPGHNAQVGPGSARIGRPIFDGRVVGGQRQTEPCNTSGTNTGGTPVRPLLAEHTFTWQVAGYLKKDVEALGARVVMTRPDDNGWGPCVDRRAKILNRAHADVAIDLHGDGNEAAGARGFALLLPVRSGVNDEVVAPSRTYALALRRALRGTGMPVSNYDGVRGLRSRPDLGGLNLTRVPQVLAELGNMRNPADARLMASRAFQRKAAAAIARAMVAFLRH